ncbi:MAG TPA: hypothetical protein VJ752_22215 [Burkholderiaceae bacterium]|nr:hypothetical protein [Burkholderiaceae bacterium]
MKEHIVRAFLFNCTAAFCFIAASPSAVMANGNVAPPTDGIPHPFALKYDFKTIDVPDASGTKAYGINDLGHVVGTFSHPQIPGQFSLNHGFLLKNGEFTTIEYPHAPGETPDIAEFAYDINNQGQIVGSYRMGHGFDYGFRIDGGIFSTISTSEFDVTAARGITDAGTIIGNFNSTRIPDLHSFMLKNKVFTVVDVPASISTTAHGINIAEDIVGEYVGSDGKQHGYLSRRGSITVIDRPGAQSTTPYGINARGQIVGSTFGETAGTHGFLLAKGKYFTIDYPGAVSTEVFGINNRSQVVGDYQDAEGRTHGFVATPKYRVDTGDDQDGSMLLLPFSRP